MIPLPPDTTSALATTLTPWHPWPTNPQGVPMTDAPVPAAPKKGMNPILKWLLIGCGTIVLLCILAFASCVYLVKKKVYDPAKAEYQKAGGAQGISAGLQVTAVEMMQPGVMMALPESERPAAQKAFKDLGDKATQLDAQDTADLRTALDAFNQANAASAQGGHGGLDAGAARAFVASIQAIADRH